jgi:hypothetical protein
VVEETTPLSLDALKFLCLKLEACELAEERVRCLSPCVKGKLLCDFVERLSRGPDYCI